jgi:cyclic lactone autoinducer peptide
MLKFEYILQKGGKKMKKFLASLVVLFMFILGLLSITGACWAYYYQAEMPQKPQK